jgi:ribosomal protein L14E/L6E/L27E
MNEYKLGQIVKSKAGRDINNLFVIIDIQGEYLYLVDGDVRRVDNPKKKKRKHVQPMNVIIDLIRNKLLDDRRLTNADVRKELAVYNTDQ